MSGFGKEKREFKKLSDKQKNRREYFANKRYGPSASAAAPSAADDTPSAKLTRWFEDKKKEAYERVDVIKDQLKNLQEKPGHVFSILNQNHSNYQDYDFFKWVVLYCEVKDFTIQLGRQCFVDKTEEIMQNRGIVKNNGYSHVFIDCVKTLFPQLFENMSAYILSKEYPGRGLYPSPLLMFEDIISNWTDRMKPPTLFGDKVSSEQLSSLYGYDKQKLSPFVVDTYQYLHGDPSVYKLIYGAASEYYFDDIISKMYRLSMIPRRDGDAPRLEPNGALMESINKTNYITSVDNEETRREPISIVSFLRHPSVDFNINNNVDNFVVYVSNANTIILDDIRYILSCAILIQLNTHYQYVSDWTPGIQMLQGWSEKTFPRKIDTAWKFYDILGSPEIKKSETNDLKLRLKAYHDNLDKIVKKKEAKDYNKYLENRKKYPKPAGGSKTKKQKKQRQRKQKSKRKKN